MKVKERQSPAAEVDRYKATSRLEEEQPMESNPGATCSGAIPWPRDHPPTFPVTLWPWLIFSILVHLFPLDGSLILKLIFWYPLRSFKYQILNANIIYESLLMAH